MNPVHWMEGADETTELWRPPFGTLPKAFLSPPKAQKIIMFIKNRHHQDRQRLFFRRPHVHRKYLKFFLKRGNLAER